MLRCVDIFAPLVEVTRVMVPLALPTETALDRLACQPLYSAKRR